MSSRHLALACVLALTAVGCRGTNTPPPPPSAEPIQAVPGQQLPGGSATVEIAFLGDSLTAGLGLKLEEAFPHLIEEMFHNEGYGEVEVLNAGVSGDTTAGGLRRVETVLTPATRILVVALGGNDALRGLTTQQTHDNIASIVEGALQRGLAVMVCGMEAPTNLGEDYQQSFRERFLQIAREYRGRITYVPFLLEGVAGNPSLNQPDGIHPTQEGAKVIAEHLYPSLRSMVDQLAQPGVQ